MHWAVLTFRAERCLGPCAVGKGYAGVESQHRKAGNAHELGKLWESYIIAPVVISASCGKIGDTVVPRIATITRSEKIVAIRIRRNAGLKSP